MDPLRSLLATGRDAVRTQLWPIPALAVLVAVIAGLLVPHLDESTDDRLPHWLDATLFDGGADSARTVLDAVSSSLITVTSLTFSLTVVTLQLASSQFSPRLLRTFARDLFVQGTLALFLATFAFSLTTLRTVRDTGDAGGLFVPRIAVSAAFVLAVASVFALVLFLAHLTQQIRVETMLRTVHTEASSTIRSTLRSAEEPTPDAPNVPAGAQRMLSPRSGFVIRVAADRLVRAAVDADAVIRLQAHVGRLVVRDVPFARVWGRDGVDLGSGSAELHECVRDAVAIGHERTAAQDVGFGLRQLTDVANKALSPGINDPTTAVHALGHLSALLCDLAGRQLGAEVLCDDDGVPRLVLERPDLADLLEHALGQPRRYGADDPQVLAQLFRVLGDLAWRTSPAQRPVVAEQLDRLERTVAAQDLDPGERAELDTLAQRVRTDLSRPVDLD